MQARLAGATKTRKPAKEPAGGPAGADNDGSDDGGDQPKLDVFQLKVDRLSSCTAAAIAAAAAASHARVSLPAAAPCSRLDMLTLVSFRL